MKPGQQDRRAKQRERRKGGNNGPASVAAHKAFAPLLGLWGAVLGGLILLTELFRLLTGQMRDEDLVMIQESEESPHGADKA